MNSACGGCFIVIEGPEGAGKTTQARALGEALRGRGYKVLLTHEPGGTPTGEEIRRLFLSGEHAAITPLTELFLICASRAQHVTEVIRPALHAGQVVLCDRFSPSTIVYQGYAGGLPLPTVQIVDEAARDGLRPDLTVILDVPAEVGLARNLCTTNADRIEEKGVQFHRRVRQGYLEYARTAPEDCVVIPAEADFSSVREKLLRVVLNRLEAEEA